MAIPQLLALPKTRPFRLFATILFSVFAVEVAVMFALPHLVPPGSSVTFTAVLDSCLLTIGLAPLIWWLIVQPLQRLADFRQRMLALVLSAQEDERRRIAGELHDGLGQTLTSLLIRMRAIEESSSDQQLQDRLHDLRNIGAGAHDEIRRISRGLRPVVLDDAGLIPALERLLSDLRASHKIEVHSNLDDVEKTRASTELETALYRITQEALANATRHGKATQINVTLHCEEPGHLELSIDDNGSGFCPADVMSERSGSSPFGLLSIYERATLLGGEAKIESQKGTGTRIRVRVPIAGTRGIDGENTRPVS